MNYCKNCSIPILRSWQGWPLRQPVPLLPRALDGSCESCGLHESISSDDIQWLNHHERYNTGLPDYWTLEVGLRLRKRWGAPYFCETTCRRCGGRAVLSRLLEDFKTGCLPCFEEEERRLKKIREEEQIRQIELEAALKAERQAYLKSLSDMSIEQRIATIAGDKSISFFEGKELREKYSKVDQADIAELDAKNIQNLIDLCESYWVLRLPGILQPLYNRRHHLRQLAIDEIRARFKGLAPHDQLTNLVVATDTPLPHFPVELADAISAEWLATLPEQKRLKFLSELGRCKLRVWSRVHRKLRLPEEG